MYMLQAEVEGFNQRWGKHRGDASLVEFLALAQQAADSLFGQAFGKLASQVLTQVSELFHRVGRQKTPRSSTPTTRGSHRYGSDMELVI